MKGTFVSQVNFRIEKLGFSTVWKGLRNPLILDKNQKLGKLYIPNDIAHVAREITGEIS